MLKAIKVILAAAALAVLAAGESAAADLVRIGAGGNTGNLIMFIGVDKGIFTKHGINASLFVRNTGPELSKSLQAGEIDFAPAAMSNLPVALERGMDVRAFVNMLGSPYSKMNDDATVGIAARPGSAINSVADLKGKRIGVTFGTTADAYLLVLLKQNGIEPSALQRINVLPANIVSLFDTGGIEAMVAWEHFLTAMVDKVKGSKVIVRGGGHVCFCATMHGPPSRVYGNKELVQRFVDAVSESAHFVRDPKNRDEVAAIGVRYIRGMSPDLIKRTLPHFIYDPRIGQNTFRSFEQTVRLLISQKKMKTAYDPKRYYDTSFIDSTVKRHPEWFKDLPPGS